MLAVCLAQKGEQERAGSSPVKKKEDRERERAFVRGTCLLLAA